jgi:hypothetical protein
MLRRSASIARREATPGPCSSLPVATTTISAPTRGPDQQPHRRDQTTRSWSRGHWNCRMATA